MAIVVFSSIAILFSVSFVVTRRRIHLFEGIVIWCVLQQIQNNYSGILSEDYELIVVSTKVAEFLAYDIMRCVIVPLSIFLFLEKTMTEHGVWRKIWNWIVIIIVLVGIEHFAEALGILAYSNKWTLGWVFAYWTTVVALSYAAFKIFRMIAKKEVRIWT